MLHSSGKHPGCRAKGRFRALGRSDRAPDNTCKEPKGWRRSFVVTLGLCCGRGEGRVTLPTLGLWPMHGIVLQPEGAPDTMGQRKTKDRPSVRRTGLGIMLGSGALRRMTMVKQKMIMITVSRMKTLKASQYLLLFAHQQGVI